MTCGKQYNKIEKIIDMLSGIGYNIHKSKVRLKGGAICLEKYIL